MIQALEQFETIDSLARWKLKRDLDLSTERAHWSEVQGWVNKLAAYAHALGRDPREVSITQDAVSDPAMEKEWPQNSTEAQSRFKRIFKVAKRKKLRIVCEGTQLGAFATMTRLLDYGLDIEIIADYPTGKSLTRSLEAEGYNHFDFAVMALAPTVMEASSKFSMNYGILRILHLEEVLFLQKRPRRPGGKYKKKLVEVVPESQPLLYLVRNSSAHASVLRERNLHRYLDNAAQVINIASIPTPPGAQFVIWEPIARWLLSKPYFRLEPRERIDKHPIALFYGRHLETADPQDDVRQEFNTLFWLEWSKLCAAHNRTLAWESVARNMPVGFCDQFGDRFNAIEFGDYYTYRSEPRPQIDVLSRNILKLMSTGTFNITQLAAKLNVSSQTVGDRADLLIRYGLASRPGLKKAAIITAKGTRFLNAPVA